MNLKPKISKLSHILFLLLTIQTFVASAQGLDSCCRVTFGDLKIRLFDFYSKKDTISFNIFYRFTNLTDSNIYIKIRADLPKYASTYDEYFYTKENMKFRATEYLKPNLFISLNNNKGSITNPLAWTYKKQDTTICIKPQDSFNNTMNVRILTNKKKITLIPTLEFQPTKHGYGQIHYFCQQYIIKSKKNKIKSVTINNNP